MVTLPELVRAIVPHGTGAMVIDPHEYANVLGMDGIRYVLESSKNLPIDFFIMLPSSIPATHLETAGARFTADDLHLMIADDRVAGIAELMNYPGVFLGIESELAKIKAGKSKVIDGHAPGLRGKNLNAYALAGVRSDHESTEQEEAREKLRLGLHVLVREGSTERNLEHIIGLVTPENSANCSFATDDKLPGDLVREGHIDHSIRKAIAHGVPPITAIQMGTINTARHYQLKNHGAIAPRFWADLIVIDDLKTMSIQRVYKKGKLVAQNGRYTGKKPPEVPQPRSTRSTTIPSRASWFRPTPRRLRTDRSLSPAPSPSRGWKTLTSPPCSCRVIGRPSWSPMTTRRPRPQAQLRSSSSARPWAAMESIVSHCSSARKISTS